MTKHDESDGSPADKNGRRRPSSRKALSDTGRGVDDSASASVGKTVDEVRGKSAAAAASLYREGRAFLEHQEITEATAELSEAIKRNPLAAVGIAFTAGLVLALLTRG